MRRFETLLALVAVVLASLAALQIRGRLLFALAAVVLLLFVGLSRMRASMTAKKKPKAGFDAYDRAERIREERDRRLGH
jgi:uncharacterized membrane protein